MNSLSCFFLLLFVFTVESVDYSCLVPNALFGFTDSLSDTGNLMLVGPPTPANFPPYGMTIHDVTGRWCDGLLIIDYLNLAFAKHLERPSFGRNSSSTAYTSLGFGSAGSTVLEQPYPGMNPDILPRQVEQFLEYQQQLYNASTATPELFSNALYYVEIGGNDVNFAIAIGNRDYDDIVENLIPQVMQGLRDSIAALHVKGSAVHFLVFGMPAAGCTPIYLAKTENGTHDRYGCSLEVNYVVKQFNIALQSALNQLREEYPEANIIYFDFFRASFELLKNGPSYGFSSSELLKACCGAGGGDYNCIPSPVGCGCAPDATPCTNPHTHISWDGIHYTQHFYKEVAKMILHGAFMVPSTPMSTANCLI